MIAKDKISVFGKPAGHRQVDRRKDRKYEAHTNDQPAGHGQSMCYRRKIGFYGSFQKRGEDELGGVFLHAN